jgi:hypothetical protein
MASTSSLGLTGQGAFVAHGVQAALTAQPSQPFHGGVNIVQQQRFGMKVLTSENWVTPDAIHANFGFSDMTRAPDPLEQGRRDVEHLCSIALTDAAANDVKAMFEVAKATMA